MRSIRSPHIRLAGIFGMLALFGAGCGGGHSSANAYAYMTWSLYDVGDTAQATPLACADVGAGDIVLTMVNTATQMTYTDTFPCASTNYSGTSAYVPSGTYAITVSLYGDVQDYGNNTTLLDQLSSTQTLVSGGNTLGSSAFLVNSFVLDWVVTSGGLASSCTAVGGRYVELDVTFSGLGQTKPVAYYLDCTGYKPAATLSIPMATSTTGTYAVTWQAYLVDANKYDVVGSVPTQLAGYTVTNGIQANLGTAYFSF